MNAFVTGATGYIGRHLINQLLKAKVTITALVRNKMHGLPGQVKTVMGDITDTGSLKNNGNRYDFLFHLAAAITFDPRRGDDLTRVNYMGTVNILEAARQWRVKRTVIVSSACTLGISLNADTILDEKTQFFCQHGQQNPYMQSKIAAEKIAATYARIMHVVVVNPTTVYGPGDWSLNSGSLVKQVFLSKILPIPPGGSNVVDVADVARGIIAAAKRGTSGQRYILGGKNLTFHQIVTLISQVIDRKPLLLHLPGFTKIPVAMAAHAVGKLNRNRFMTSQLIGDMYKYKYYSAHAAKYQLDWRPEFTFEDSIRRAWKFYRAKGLLKLKNEIQAAGHAV